MPNFGMHLDFFRDDLLEDLETYQDGTDRHYVTFSGANKSEAVEKALKLIRTVLERQLDEESDEE